LFCGRGSLCRGGSRGAMVRGGNGTLEALSDTSTLPAVCQAAWTCPMGHACDVEKGIQVREAGFPRGVKAMLEPCMSKCGPLCIVALCQVLCGLGWYSAAGACQPCSPGRHNPVSAASSCLTCPGNAPYSQSGSAMCTSCVSGCSDGVFGRASTSRNTTGCPGGHACVTASQTEVRVFPCRA
jgi:hypothetical protein